MSPLAPVLEFGVSRRCQWRSAVPFRKSSFEAVKYTKFRKIQDGYPRFKKPLRTALPTILIISNDCAIAAKGTERRKNNLHCTGCNRVLIYNVPKLDRCFIVQCDRCKNQTLLNPKTIHQIDEVVRFNNYHASRAALTSTHS